jgi:HAAS domain-containing protein
MTAVHADQLVDGYISRLELALLDLPPERRREIVDDIRTHIADERGNLEHETDADLLNLLERLGEPADIAAAARDGQSTSRQGGPGGRFGLIEVLALILTPLVWPAGVVLLWLSAAWTTRQKLLGTLIWPGGYPGLLILLPLVLAIGHRGGCATQFDDQGRVVWTTCPSELQQTLAAIATVIVVVIALLLPVGVGIYLATRLKARPASA